MSAAAVNLQIEQGADLELVLTWQDADGTPIDLTGYSAAAQGRPSASSGTLLFNLTNAAGITLGGTAGTVTVRIGAAVTSLLPAGLVGVWDITLTSPGGVVYRLAEGNVSCDPGVTR